MEPQRLQARTELAEEILQTAAAEVLALAKLTEQTVDLV
jgi:hypothetical protein